MAVSNGGTGAAPGTLLPDPSVTWTGLNPNLIARFFAVDNKGVPVQPQIEVCAPLTDVHMDAVLNWQSPFESSSPDTKAPALMAMVQSGLLATVLADTTNVTLQKASQPLQNFANQQNQALQSLQGMTGITKLNSVQVFTGMPPLKIQLTALFRAFADPQSEVEQPFVQLMSWALPQKLSADSIVQRVSNANQSGGGVSAYLKALLPSIAPTMVGFQYKRRLYAPMVIESIGEPMSSPIDVNGFYTELAVPMTIATLTALDKDDYALITQNSPTGSTNSSGNTSQ